MGRCITSIQSEQLTKVLEVLAPFVQVIGSVTAQPGIVALVLDGPSIPPSNPGVLPQMECTVQRKTEGRESVTTVSWRLVSDAPIEKKPAFKLDA